MTDTKLLRDKIKSSGIKQSHIATLLGLSNQALINKIENDSEFKASEIHQLRKILKLTAKERDSIFFA